MSALTIMGYGDTDRNTALTVVSAFGGTVLSEKKSTRQTAFGPIEGLAFECDVPDRQFTRCRLALIGADLGFLPPLIVCEGGHA